MTTGVFTTFGIRMQVLAIVIAVTSHGACYGPLEEWEFTYDNYRFVIDQMDAYILLDDLRQSSSDLTRMSRLYSVTGEKRYQDYFNRILDIRNGDAPRPRHRNPTYWDTAIATGELPPADGGQVSMHELLWTHPKLAWDNMVAEALEKADALAAFQAEVFDKSLQEAQATLLGEEHARLNDEALSSIGTLMGIHALW